MTVAEANGVNEYGVLLVGGMRSHQENHADVFNAHPRCHLVAVSDEKGIPPETAELNRGLASVWSIPYIDDLDVALARDDIHVVSAVPQVERRGTVGASCIEAGKHVYFDKPLAGSVEDLDMIAAAANSSDVTTQMFCTIKAGWARGAREVVESGSIGELKYVHLEGLFAKGRAGSIPDGVVRKETERPSRYTFIEGKHEMFDVTIYSMAVLRALTDKPIETVFGHTGNYFHKQHVEMDVEDFGVLGLTLEGGVSATVVGGRFGWMSHPQSGPQKVVLVGTEGSMTFDSSRPRVEVYNDEPDFTLPPDHPMDPSGMWSSTGAELDISPKRRWVGLHEGENTMAEDVADFIDCIDTGRTPEITAQVAAPITEAILAGYVSAARGEPVSLPLPR